MLWKSGLGILQVSLLVKFSFTRRSVWAKSVLGNLRDTMPRATEDMSIEELKQLLQRKREKASKEWQVEGYKIKMQVDEWILRHYGKQLKAWGKKPGDIYMCPNPDKAIKKGDTFEHPDTKLKWTYGGKGMVPNWLRGNEEVYRVAAQGG